MLDQLNEGQFLFNSIIFYTKIKSSFILQVFWTPVVLNFSHSNKKGKAIKHQNKSGLRNMSCNSTWSILKRVSMRSTCDEGRTRQLSELESGKWINMDRNIAFLKQFSCPQELEHRIHIRSQAELTDFVLVEVNEVRLHGTSGLLRNILIKYLQNRLQI